MILKRRRLILTAICSSLGTLFFSVSMFGERVMEPSNCSGNTIRSFILEHFNEKLDYREGDFDSSEPNCNDRNNRSAIAAAYRKLIRKLVQQKQDGGDAFILTEEDMCYLPENITVRI